MKFDEPHEWPATQWSRFLECLRAFCLSDAQQNAYFPVLQEPRYHCAMGGDGYTLSSYYLPLSDACDLCGALLQRCDPTEEDLMERLWNTFCESARLVTAPTEASRYSPVSTTNFANLALIRPRLRTLCGEALVFFGAEERAPLLEWDEI